MENSEKELIVKDLREYMTTFDSQNQAAKSLDNVSVGTISQMINGKWTNISDAMWRSVGAQIKSAKSGTAEWKIVETANFKTYWKTLQEAQKYSIAFGVIGDEGSSKTETAKNYCAANKNAFRLKCGDHWNKKYFLEQLLKTMGRDYSGFTVSEMIDDAVRVLKSLDKPLIVLDEADKLSDQVLYFFITLYNELEDHCGIVVTATTYLKKRFEKGVRLNKKGYREMFSRLGRKFIVLPGVKFTDIKAICLANAITDDAEIKAIWEDSECDLRRVKRKIHALKNKQYAD